MEMQRFFWSIFLVRSMGFNGRRNKVTFYDKKWILRLYVCNWYIWYNWHGILQNSFQAGFAFWKSPFIKCLWSKALTQSLLQRQYPCEFKIKFDFHLTFQSKHYNWVNLQLTRFLPFIWKKDSVLKYPQEDSPYRSAANRP